MEETPRVHRHRHRRTESRHRRNERQANRIAENKSTAPAQEAEGVAAAEEGACAAGSDAREAVGGCEALIAAVATRLSQQNERPNSMEGGEGDVVRGQTSSPPSQQTVVLVNGQAPPQESASNMDVSAPPDDSAAGSVSVSNKPETEELTSAGGGGGGAGSSRNSSGDALSLRETLQQLPPTLTTHRHRRTHSPQSPARRVHETAADASFHRGILGFMDRELKQCSPTPSARSIGAASAGSSGAGVAARTSSRRLQSLSDPQASPAQRSIRSRSSLDKSPRRKRSKSESRRRRERKLIAAGEMEVRQANETLMRYLKQCSEMNDASLSGELEIDQNYDERRIQRKTKSQRDKRGHIISKFYTAGGLSSILKELSDDVAPADGDEIYNPFTPVVSPTDDTPAHIDKLYLQTSSGYRPVEHCYYKHSFMGPAVRVGRMGVAAGRGAGGGGGGGADDGGAEMGVGGVGVSAGIADVRSSAAYGGSRFLLLGGDCGREDIKTKIQLACFIQRIWLLVSNICHGLLAGLALAHLLFVVSSQPMVWSKVIGLAGETVPPSPDDGHRTSTSLPGPPAESRPTPSAMADYATFASLYLNTFYCLAVVCMVSVLDRMDICSWSISNAAELISFRWLVIAMTYIATIILTICSDAVDEKLYFNRTANATLTQEEWLSNGVVGAWSSLSVTRSIGAVFGWIMVGLTPFDDLLFEHLLDLARYQLTNN